LSDNNDNNNNKYSINYDKIFSFSSIVRLVEPYNYKDIFNKTDSEQKIEALNNEYDSFEKLIIYTRVEKVPKGTNIIKPKIVFKYKIKPKSELDKRKVRVVACSYSQKEGIDFD